MESLLLLFVAIAGIVWGGVLMLRGSLIGGCLAFLISATTFGHDFVHFNIGPIPLTIDRIVLLGLMGSYVVQRKLGLADPKPMTPLDGLLLAFIATLTISMLCAGWRVKLPTEVSPVWRLGGGYVIPLTIYWIARQAPLDAKHVRLVQTVFVAFGVYLAITGLCEVLDLWSLVFPKYIRNPNIGLHFGRARGPMVHSVTYGMYLGTATLALWELLRDAPTRARKLALATLLPLFAAGLLASLTRSVWIGMGLAAMIVAALTFPPAWRRLTIGAAAAVGIGLLVFKLDALVGLQREGTVADTRQSVDMRGSFAYVSWLMFQDHPILGFGFGQFPSAKLDYLSDRSTAMPLEQIRGYVHHNGYLSLLTETGLVGLALFLTVPIGWSYRAWRLWQEKELPSWERSVAPMTLGVLALYLCQLMFHELSYTPLDHSLVFFIAGLNANLTTEAALKRSHGTKHAIGKWSLRFARPVTAS